MRLPRTLSSTSALVPLGASVVLAFAASGCGGSGNDDADTFIAVILGAVLGLLLLGCCGFTYATAVLVAGVANTQHNIKRPSSKSKTWGFVWGPLNLINSAVGIWFLYAIATGATEEPPEASTYAVLILGVIATAAVGSVCLVKALQAVPQPSIEARLEDAAQDSAEDPPFDEPELD